jgi:hypothetical protein
MSNDKHASKSKAHKKETKISSADDLIKTGKSGEIELDEVYGGGAIKSGADGKPYLKVDYDR